MPARSNRNFLSPPYFRAVLKPGLIIVALVVTPLWSAPKWSRTASTHFEVLTDSGERTGRRVLSRFEQARHVFSSLLPSFRSELPCRVFVFSSERDYNQVRPGAAVTGFYQSGPDRDSIAMLDGAPDLYRVVLHEYTHLVMNHSLAKLPPWLEEGLAEFFSTMAPKEGEVTVGYPVRTHMDLLATSGWLTAAQLSAVTKDSPEYNERPKAGLFYAESWALTHMLILSPAYGGGLPKLLDGIAAGRPVADAFQTAFGKTMEQAFGDLRPHLSQDWHLIEVPVPPYKNDAEPAVSAISLEQVMIAKAELLMVMGRNETAATMFEEVARKFPNTPGAETGLAALAVRAQRYDEAVSRFERAIQEGASDGSTFFEYAMLLRDTKAPAARVDEFLHKTVQASPGFAEAHFLLGVRASDRGDYSAAVEHLRRATEILPRQCYFWHALAFAYYKLGQIDDSRAAAYRAVNAAASPGEEAMARAALNLTAANRPEARPAVITPPAWNNRRGDHRVDGLLIAVECQSSPVRLRVRTGERVIDFRVGDPKSVVLKGGNGATVQLECGPNDGRPVAIEYIGDSSEVTAIEFK